MARRVLESLSGIGEVYAGDVLLRKTRYQIDVWVDENAGAGTEADNAVKVSGQIDITGMAEAVVLAGPQELTLRLKDGRRLSFALTGSGGTIIGRGGLQS